jgi:hypothetical protein
MHPRLSFEARLRPRILAILGIGVDELPIGRVGFVIAVAPECELNPNALAPDSANRSTAKAVLHPPGKKPQNKDRVAQAVRVVRVEEKAFLTHVTGPEAPQVVAHAKDVKTQTEGNSHAVAALHATSRSA